MAGPTPAKVRKGIPDRWMYCPKVGSLIMDLFLPFKTPLCALYDPEISDKKLRFHPEDVMNHVNLDGKKVGLWIDLTKTDRYYFSDEFAQQGCIYKKLPLAGHNATPTPEETQTFIDIVTKFEKANPGKVVGVHCTHGFNRTGFLIVAYLFHLGWALDAAVGEFRKARPDGIYKQDYIDDLFKRFGDEDDDIIQSPGRPLWENGDPGSFEASNGDGASTSRQQKASGKQFMDGRVAHVYLCEDDVKKKMLQSKIRELCGFRKQGFPGLQPVSLSRDNLKMLAMEPYKVSWKADGMRYMVYIYDKNEIYAFDRDNEVFEISNLQFPGRKGGHVRNTLVDAEMIIDKVEINGVVKELPRLLIYDIIQFQEINIAKQNFDIRTECIRRELIFPRNEAMKRGQLDQNSQSMSVRIKEFWLIEAVAKLFEPKFTQNVGHEIDGLIFQPVNQPYSAGRCDTVLKWKPPSHNSVDFKLHIEKVQKEGFLPEYKGLLYVLHSDQPFGFMKATNTLKKYDNKIIECTLKIDHEGRPMEWVFMRERTDKSAPNAFTTAANVVETMLHPITKDFLCTFIAKQGFKLCERRRDAGDEPPQKRPR
ncbi:unnamed protein product [Caenorhabditis auriculariae]|uniref:mRNA-capping enzyme n=1 Tax=Caenorhabditis auriculariae TaxID=2777116 RepID=A0A8S1HGY6_9PELO|nr:unnamed protein product [Caenorhabditis auriculariae]